jgi:hypothetical protein
VPTELTVRDAVDELDVFTREACAAGVSVSVVLALTDRALTNVDAVVSVRDPVADFEESWSDELGREWFGASSPRPR